MADPKITLTPHEPDVTVNIKVASEGKDGYTPQRGVDYYTEEDKAEIKKYIDRQIGAGGGGGGVYFETDETLSLVDGVLGVNTAHEPDPDNTLPITSAAVYTTVGNINALLETI